MAKVPWKKLCGAVMLLAAPFVLVALWLACTVATFSGGMALQGALAGAFLALALLLASGSLRTVGALLASVVYAAALLVLAGDAASWILQESSFNERFFAHAAVRNLIPSLVAYPWAIGLALAALVALIAVAGVMMMRASHMRMSGWVLAPALALAALALTIDAPPQRLLAYSVSVQHEQALASSGAARKIRKMLDLKPSTPHQVHASAGRNLVFVYLESVERTYVDESRFPGLTPNIDRLRKQGLDFSGFRTFPGATYTIAGMFASQCGAPFLLNNVFGEDIGELEFVPGNDNTTAASFHPQLACLGDVLHAAGYTQAFLSGVSLGFTNKGDFLRMHGYDEALGNEQIDARHGNALVKLGWGLLDRDVFAEALTTYQREQASGQPFSVVMSTADTHPPGGYMLPGCEPYAAIRNDMLDAVHCTDRLLGQFIERLSHEPKWKDTVVVVMSDHLAMRNVASPLYPPIEQRQPLLFVLNAGHGERPVRLLHMDIAPTVLSLLGVHSDVRFLAGSDRSAVSTQDALLPDNAVAEAVLRKALWHGRAAPTLCADDVLVRWDADSGIRIGGWTLPLMSGGWPVKRLGNDQMLLVVAGHRSADLQILVAGNQDHWLDVAREKGSSVFLAAPFVQPDGQRRLALDWLAPNGAWASLGSVPNLHVVNLHSPACGSLLHSLQRANPGSRLDFSSAFGTTPVAAAHERQPGIVSTTRVPANTTPTTNVMFMFARIIAEQTGFGPIRITQRRRIFMHPAADQPAWAEFDVSGIDHLTLSPRINPLLGACRTRDDTGVVGVKLILDGKDLAPRFLVDRDYSTTLPIEVAGAARLRIEVDEGNATPDCDWFSFGFPTIDSVSTAVVGAGAH